MADSSPSNSPRYNGAKHTVRVAPKKFNAFAPPRCPTCDKSVYAAEQALGPASRPYHKLCLKCTECGALLSPTSLVDHEYQPYCKNCHGRLFGPKGVGFGNALAGEYEVRRSPRSTPTRAGSVGAVGRWESPGSPTATRSAGTPSSAMRRPSARNGEDEGDDGLPDLSTLKLTPSKSLTSGSPLHTTRRPDPRLAAGDEDDFDAPSLTPDGGGEEEDGWQPPSLPNPVFTISARPGTSTTGEGNGRTSPLPPPRSHSPASPGSTSRSGSPRPFSPPTSSHAARPPSPLKHSSLPPSSSSIPAFTPPRPTGDRNGSPVRSPASTRGSAAGSPAFDPVARSRGLGLGPAVCPRCEGVVYFAEQVLAAGSKWHKRCLRCVKCNKALDAGSLSEREGMPYCKKCYGENFGNEAQGFVLRAGFTSR